MSFSRAFCRLPRCLARYYDQESFLMLSQRPLTSALLSATGYLEGQGNLVSRLIRAIPGATVWVIRVIHLLTKSP